MKALLMVVIFVCFVSIGISIGNYYKKRRDFYVELCNFCDFASSQLSFSLKKTSEIVSLYKKNCTSDFVQCLNNYEDFLSGVLTENDFKTKNKILFLSQEELEEINNFILSFGQMNLEEELEKNTLFKNKFAKRRTFCLESFKKYKSLYTKLFILLGLVFVVIFL